MILLFAILIGFFCKSNSTFEGGPHNLDRPIPKEAVPLWQTSELHWKVRFFLGYIFAQLVPVGSLVKCPTVVDWSNEQEAEAAKSCINPIRSTIESGDDSVDLHALFDVQSVDIDRAGGGTDDNPLRVTLLKKRRSTSAADDSDTAAVDDNKSSGPLILYMHGGGFTVRGGKNALAAQMFSSLLQKAEEDEDDHGSFMDDAVWAVVEYRLAPEHTYPAATEDCLLALNHLVNEMNLGGKGIHINGVSAGATLAMEVTLKSIDMNIDSFFVDEPMVPLPSKNDGWSFDSSSFRRYSYARIPPVSWLEWSLKAMTGMETHASVESNIPYGMITTNVDITGGSLEVADWKHAFENSNATLLPTLFLATAYGDPLKDGGVYFKQVYEQVIEQVEGEKLSSERTEIKYFETKTGHTLFYALEPSVFEQMMSEWYTVMRKAHGNRHQ